MKGIVLVIAQLAVIGVLLSQVTRALLQPLPLCGLVTSFALLGWAVASMGPRKVRVRPEPSAKQTLCERGPYRWIRHPMYSATLLMMLMIAVSHPSWIAITAWLMLLTILWIKLRHEERLFETAIPAYRDYRLRTKRLIPLVI